MICHAVRGRRYPLRSRPRVLGAAALALWLAPRCGLAFPNEPEGFGAARFGQSAENVRRALPALQPAGGIPDAGITTFRLDGQRFLDLTCGLRLNFLADQLYEIQFDCGRDPAVVAALEKAYGRPVLRESYGTFWYGQKVAVSLNETSKSFGISDRARMSRAQNVLLGVVTRAPRAE